MLQTFLTLRYNCLNVVVFVVVNLTLNVSVNKQSITTINSLLQTYVIFEDIYRTISKYNNVCIFNI